MIVTCNMTNYIKCWLRSMYFELARNNTINQWCWNNFQRSNR